MHIFNSWLIFICFLLLWLCIVVLSWLWLYIILILLGHILNQFIRSLFRSLSLEGNLLNLLLNRVHNLLVSLILRRVSFNCLMHGHLKMSGLSCDNLNLLSYNRIHLLSNFFYWNFESLNVLYL